jgi:hypothetical protein
MRKHLGINFVFLLVLAAGFVIAALTVPTDIQQPGTQPNEVGNLETPDKCDNCHGGYNASVEPSFTWRGSMMANAGRDPIFWATLAVAEQDFDGAGDLCIRCHSTGGWLSGRSTPTDGSGLFQGDSDGVECDFCHKMTNPDNSELLGVQTFPFIANDGGNPAVGYYGSGMYSLWAGNEKLGPYSDAMARHQFIQSRFHRDVDFCGTCHDVSNPAVGDLAHNNGTQPTAGPVIASGIPGSPEEGKAAFNNFPYMYGIVERTFSEFKSGLLSQTLVSDYGTLLPELQQGAIQVAYDSSVLAGTSGNYADNTDRYFSCQTCHLRPVNGTGCNKKGVPARTDLPLHDMTGGNYWMPDAIQWLDMQGRLRLGGGMTSVQIAALNEGRVRAIKQLNEAAALEVTGNTLRITNLTGHKLISGYPEGRRMWINIKWFDGQSQIPLREDGEYGPIDTVINGTPTTVNSLIDPYDTNTKVYEAHYGMTQEWANQLIALAYPTTLALSYDRYTGVVDYTLGDLGASAPGSTHETFHFVLNNTVVKDNRIPPYGMSYDEAAKRNALPVPANQYNGGNPGSTYLHFDEITLNPPANAVYATIDLVYQPTSWEYIQFLHLANDLSNPFLADEGQALLDAWLSTGMAEPHVMTSTTWGTAPVPAVPKMYADSLVTNASGKRGALIPESIFKAGDSVIFVAHIVDENSLNVAGAQVFMEIRDSGANLVANLQGFSDDTGTAVLTWKSSRRDVADIYTAEITSIINTGYEFELGNAGAVYSVTFTIQ